MHKLSVRKYCLRGQLQGENNPVLHSCYLVTGQRYVGARWRKQHENCNNTVLMLKYSADRANQWIILTSAAVEAQKVFSQDGG